MTADVIRLAERLPGVAMRMGGHDAPEPYLVARRDPARAAGEAAFAVVAFAGSMAEAIAAAKAWRRTEKNRHFIIYAPIGALFPEVDP